MRLEPNNAAITLDQASEYLDYSDGKFYWKKVYGTSNLDNVIDELNSDK